MLKRLLLSSVFVAGLATPAAADYAAGLAAYANDDYASAYREFYASARTGDPQSEYMLGRLYELGRGVRQDFVQAHVWYNLAAAQGHRQALAARDALANRMTVQQMAQAQQLAGQATVGQRTTVAAGSATTAASTGYSVRDIQRMLNQLGYNAGTPDGVMGSRTRIAIQQFQRDQGMAVTGQPSVLLYNRLVTAAAGGGAGTSTAAASQATTGYQPTTPTTTVSTDLVANVQAALRQRGYDVPVVNGTLDAQTQTAIRTYQADVGLPVTGRVSQSLLASLQAGSTQASQTAMQQRQLVAQIQTALNQRGYDAGPADGGLGPKTRAAIRTYQADAGLAVTGQPSVSLLQALQSNTQTQTAALSPSQTTGTQAGTDAQQRQQLVLAIEDELRARGYNPGPVDGNFDAQTSAAIRAFQRDAGIALTGQPSAELLNTIRASSIAARQTPQTPQDVANQLLQGVTSEIFNRMQKQ